MYKTCISLKATWHRFVFIIFLNNGFFMQILPVNPKFLTFASWADCDSAYNLFREPASPSILYNCLSLLIKEKNSFGSQDSFL